MHKTLAIILTGGLIGALLLSSEPASPTASQNDETAQTPREVEPICFGKQSRPVAFLDGDMRDQIEIVVDSPTCFDAVALVSLESREGKVLLRETFPLAGLSDRIDPQPQDLHTLLSRFTDSIMSGEASELGALGPESGIESQVTPEIYERAREFGGTFLCFPVHRGQMECVWHDPDQDVTLVLFTSAFEIP